MSEPSIPQAGSTHRFGRFELDLVRRELRCGGEIVHLQPRVFALLCYLVEHPHRAIDRGELLGAVWGDVRVGDGSLSRAVRALRRVLDADPALRDALQTVRGFGYRLAVDVECRRPTAPARRPATAAPLVAREAPLTEIFDHAEAARSGERRVVLIEGEPGMGKTALVRHALEALEVDFRVGVGQCIQGFGEQSPYLPVLEALTSTDRPPPSDGGGARSGAPSLRTAVERVARPWRSYLPTIFPEHEPALDAVDLERAQMARSLVELIELLAAAAPLALVIEDLQWADASTAALLESLVMRQSPAHLLLLCTARTATIDATPELRSLRSALSRSRNGRAIEIGPIPLAGVREYLARSSQVAAGSEATDLESLAGWLHERTAGHPLFLTQVCAHLSSLDLLPKAPDVPFDPARLEAAGLPKTLGQLLHQWMDDLDPHDRATLEAASVCGFYVDPRSLASAVGADPEVVEQSCDRLCERGWLEAHGFRAWPDGTRGIDFRFRHALFAEALYAAIPPGRRAGLHGSIGERLERGFGDSPAIASELAAHFEAAGALDRAARHRVAAATHATATQSVSETLHHAERGMALLHALDGQERATVELDLVIAMGVARSTRHSFGDEAAAAHFERARDLARSVGDASREAAATWGVSCCDKMRGRITEARVAGERLLELAKSTRNPRLTFFALDLLCNIAFFQGRFRACIEIAEASQTIRVEDVGEAIPSRSVEDVKAMTRTYASIAHWHLGDESAARALMGSAVETARALSHPATVVAVEAFAAVLHCLLGDDARQRAHGRRSAEIGARAAIGLWGEIGRFMEVCADPPTARNVETLRGLLEEMSRFGGLGGTFFIGLLAERARQVGHVDLAAGLVRQGIERARGTTERHHLPQLLVTAAHLAATPEERTARFDEAAGEAAAIGSVALAAQVARARAASGG